MDNRMTGVPAEIQGVIVSPLRQIEDQRGVVLHMLRCDSLLFERFGEVYFSLVYPQKVKAWKRHRLMTQHFAVPLGKIRLVLYDDREGSPTHGSVSEYIMGRPDHYHLIRIPPKIWYGFSALGPESALLANCPDMPHDPSEAETLPVSAPNIPYQW